MAQRGAAAHDDDCVSRKVLVAEVALVLLTTMVLGNRCRHICEDRITTISGAAASVSDQRSFFDRCKPHALDPFSRACAMLAPVGEGRARRRPGPIPGSSSTHLQKLVDHGHALFVASSQPRAPARASASLRSDAQTAGRPPPSADLQGTSAQRPSGCRHMVPDAFTVSPAMTTVCSTIRQV